MTREPTNHAASMRARLLELFRRTGGTFDFLLRRYAGERFLYRLGESPRRRELVLKTIAAFLSTEAGDLRIGVADDGEIVGLEVDQLGSDDEFMRYLAQVVRNGLGDRAGTCSDPKTQIVRGRTVCIVSCQRIPEPVLLKWRGLEEVPTGDLFVRSGPGTVRLAPESAQEYIRTRFPGVATSGASHTS